MTHKLNAHSLPHISAPSPSRSVTRWLPNLPAFQAFQWETMMFKIRWKWHRSRLGRIPVP